MLHPPTSRITQRHTDCIQESVYEGVHAYRGYSLTKAAWEFAFAFFFESHIQLLDFFVCFRASVSFRAIQRVPDTARTFLCFY